MTAAMVGVGAQTWALRVERITQNGGVNVKERGLTLPELGLIASTRGMLGAGVALLIGDRLDPRTRRAIGWTLLLVGAISSVPILVHVLGKPQLNGDGQALKDEG
jgi:hypothetical protein